MKWLFRAWRLVLRLWAVMTACAVAREQDRAEEQAKLQLEAERIERELLSDGVRYEELKRKDEQWLRDHGLL